MCFGVFALRKACPTANSMVLWWCSMLGMAHGPPERRMFPMGSENWDLKFSISLILIGMPGLLG